jgi:hypothetical protein
VSAGANRSENVATLASRAAASEAEIRALNPKVATASKRVEKTRLRIPPSFMGALHRNDGMALFQDGFVRPEKGFTQRAVMRSR